MVESRLADLVRTYETSTVARGRGYARDGRVTGLRRSSEGVKAFVHGTARYEVSVAMLESGRLDAGCTCEAFDRTGQCKHIAAVSLALTSDERLTASGRALPAHL